MLVGDLLRAIEPAPSVDSDGQDLVDQAFAEFGELALLHRHAVPFRRCGHVADGAMIATTVAKVIAFTTSWSSLVRVARSQAVETPD
ncbi:hypothetical protein PSD17_23740 [Pseudonocardia sp. D17]|nr:hypothetical protein PSD17_23740 [Pseudonocardia sp. D17]